MNITTNDLSTSTNSAASNWTPSAATSQISDMFLQLLVAQIKNQDPSNPTDGKEYVTQLAQLSQVQSMDSMTSLMTTTSRQVSSLQKQSIGALTGQKLMVATNTLQTDGSTTVAGRVNLPHAVSEVVLTLKDSAGKTYTQSLGSAAAGDMNFEINPQALGLPPGKYSLSVSADNNDAGINTELSGTVKSVRFPLSGNSPILNLEGIGDVDYYSITQFNMS